MRGVGEDGHIAAHHQARQLPRTARARRHSGYFGTVAQHGYSIGGGYHLVEMVCDHHYGCALDGHRFELLDQVGHLGRSQRGRGLVEDQNAGAAVQGPQDLHPLLLPDRQLSHPGRAVYGKPMPSRELGHLLGRRRDVTEMPQPASAASQYHVFGHREAGHELKVLVDHPHASVDCVMRRTQSRGLAVDLDDPFIRLLQPVQQVHQGRLACAVLAQQTVYLAESQIEIDTRHRGQRAEVLHDAPHLHHRRVGGRWVRASHCRAGPAGKIPAIGTNPSRRFTRSIHRRSAG